MGCGASKSTKVVDVAKQEIPKPEEAKVIEEPCTPAINPADINKHKTQASDIDKVLLQGALRLLTEKPTTVWKNAIITICGDDKTYIFKSGNEEQSFTISPKDGKAVISEALVKEEETEIDIPCGPAITSREISRHKIKAHDKDEMLFQQALTSLGDESRYVWSNAQIIIYGKRKIYTFHAGEPTYKCGIRFEHNIPVVDITRPDKKGSECDVERNCKPEITFAKMNKLENEVGRKDKPFLEYGCQLLSTESSYIWRNSEIIILGNRDTYRLHAGECMDYKYKVYKKDGNITHTLTVEGAHVRHNCGTRITVESIADYKEKALRADQELLDAAQNRIAQKSDWLVKSDAEMFVKGHRIYKFYSGKATNKFTILRDEHGKIEAVDGDKSGWVMASDAAYAVGEQAVGCVNELATNALKHFTGTMFST